MRARAEQRRTAQDSQSTAGFRNAQWTMEHLPEGTSVAVQPLQTHDGAASNGFLFMRGRPRTVVCIMHPREFLAAHYLIPHILEAGCAAWSQAPRAVGNDLRLEHEIALLDVAAGTAWLRRQGFEKVVLLGNSGGASLYCFYNEQSLAAPQARIRRTPGGRPTGLSDADMPPVDGVVLVSPHPGQGRLLMNCIDPAVVDEDDPFARDPALDFMSPENGFREPPEPASYEAAFVERYRVAQRDRVARIDARARMLIDTRMSARKRAKGGGGPEDRITGSHTQVMTVWCTDADLRCFDLSLDPSERGYGSVWGRNPYASNYGAVGFGRICTPESWLSTWSGLSSNAYLERTAPAIEQPALLVEYTGDNTVFPSDLDAVFDQIGSSDKERSKLRGNHHGQPLAEGEEPGRDQAGRRIIEWLHERFPIAA